MKTPATVLALSLSLSAAAQVGVGTTAPDTTSFLDVSGTVKTLVIPHLTNAAMNAIVNPPEGSLVYNTSQRRFFGCSGVATATAITEQSTSSAANQVGMA